MNNGAGGPYYEVIDARHGGVALDLGKLFERRYLIYLFFRRDFVLRYKQTIFGPLWLLIQPLLTMIVYVIVFSKIARIPTDNIPPPLFYISGIIRCNYFTNNLGNTSNIFNENAHIFSKIYFPRLVIPMARVLTSLVGFAIQFALFIAIYLYFTRSADDLSPNFSVLLLPLILLVMCMISLGIGLILSALISKYRDLRFLIGFGLQLLMFGSPVIYPLSFVPADYRYLIEFNPLSHLFELFRYSLFGTGEISLYGLSYGLVFALFILAAGIFIFNKTESRFIDTI